MASFGAFTACAYKADQKLKNKIGKLAYYLEATKTVKDIREIPMRFVIDGKVIEDEFVFGSISNSFTVGGIIKLSNDQVCLNDGRLCDQSHCGRRSDPCLCGNYQRSD